MPTSRPRPFVPLALLFPALFLAGPAPAQPAPPAPPAAEVNAEQATRPSIRLDIEALLTSPDVMPAQLSDPVWTFTPGPNRQLLLLPLAVTPGGEEATLTDPGIEVRGGRFFAWHINPDERDEATFNQEPGGPGAAAGGWGGRLLMDNNYDLGGRVPPRQPGAANPQARPAIPPDAPTFTRGITVRPDGTLRWTLDRTIPGATVTEQDNDYTLKLRADRLRALEPERPQRQRIEPGGGANPQEAARQRRTEQARYRTESEQFRELVNRVRSAPEQFEIPLPRRIYAVYEVSAAVPQLTIVGPEPLPWSISLNSLAALRGLSGQRGFGGGANADQQAAVTSLAAAARDNHPLTHRLIAIALHKADLIGQSQPNGPLFNVLRSILQGRDEPAKRIVLGALVTTVPPTQGSVMLLRDAADQLTPEMQLASLRGMLRGDVNNPVEQREMVATVNRTLADEAGPDAGVALQAMVEQVGRVDLSQAGPGSAAAAFVSGIDFERLPPHRRDQAIAYVIRDAGTEPLAAAWLNHRLLGSSDPAIVRRTLELIGRANVGSGVVADALRHLTTAVFGAPPEEAAPLDLRLSARIPIDATSHSIFRVLQHGDPAVRELAWRAIGNFGGETRSRDGGAAAAPDEVISQVLRAGLAQSPTPPRLAAFLAPQRGSARATAGLVQLVIFADNPTARAQAARALHGSERPSLGNEVRSLEPEQRADFARGMYEALRGAAPLAADVLAEPAAESLASSFGDAVARGALPDAAELAEAFGGETELLNVAAGPGPRAAAGAVGTLVAMAGGDEATARELAERFAQLPDRSLGAITEAWGVAKRDIYARRLAEAAGSYRLSVQFRPLEYDAQAYGAQPGGLPATLTPRSITIGVVDLSVEGDAAFLGNRTVTFTIPEERLALRMNNVTDLANFADANLASIGLERVQGPVDLLPQDDGTWRGEAMTPEGGTVDVRLEPVAP